MEIRSLAFSGEVIAMSRIEDFYTIRKGFTRVVPKTIEHYNERF